MHKSSLMILITFIFCYAVSALSHDKVVVVPLNKSNSGSTGTSIVIYDANDNFVANYMNFEGDFYVSAKGYYSLLMPNGVSKSFQAIYPVPGAYIDPACSVLLSETLVTESNGSGFIGTVQGWVGYIESELYYVAKDAMQTPYIIYMWNVAVCEPVAFGAGYPAQLNDPAVTGFYESYAEPLKEVVTFPSAP